MTEAFVFDPFAADFTADPYPHYARDGGRGDRGSDESVLDQAPSSFLDRLGY
jgi:hypothetical protein